MGPAYERTVWLYSCFNHIFTIAFFFGFFNHLIYRLVLQRLELLIHIYSFAKTDRELTVELTDLKKRGRGCTESRPCMRKGRSTQLKEGMESRVAARGECRGRTIARLDRGRDDRRNDQPSDTRRAISKEAHSIHRGGGRENLSKC